jgi:hypothetical protein
MNLKCNNGGYTEGRKGPRKAACECRVDSCVCSHAERATLVSMMYLSTRLHVYFNTHVIHVKRHTATGVVKWVKAQYC